MKKSRCIKRLAILMGVVTLSGCDTIVSSIFSNEKNDPNGYAKITVTDKRQNLYQIGDIYDRFVCNDGLTVTATTNSDKEVVLTKDEFTYVVTSKNAIVSPLRPFSNAGNYNVAVTVNSIKIDPLIITVNELPESKVLQSIDVTDYTDYVYKGDTYTFDGVVTAHYDDGSTADVTSKATFSEISTSSIGRRYMTVRYSENGKSISKSIEINVQIAPAEIINVTGVTLNATSKIVDVGSTVTLYETVLPSNATNKKVTWSTSDVSIASVTSSGVVRGLKAGTCDITVTTKDGGYTASCSITVNNVAVTGVSLSTSATTVGVGKSKTLTATVSPSNATDKSLIWNSDNTSIATVSANGLISGVSVGTTNITVTTVDGNKKASCAVTVEEMLDDAWTILVYMCGSNLESDLASSNNGCATLDIKEMLSVSGQPDDVNVVIQAGGASKWSSTYSSVISKDYANRCHVRNKKLVKDEQITKVSMGKSSTLQSFIEWGLNTYPAQNVGLVFWNHGGAMTGCCFDEQFNNDCLLSSETATAIKNARQSLGIQKPFEFIGYDCCLMQLQDIASLHADYAKYMIGSEESEWGYGWSYNKWLGKVYDGSSTSAIATACVNGFGQETTSAYATYGESNDQTLSVIDLAKFSTYAEKWENMSSYLASDVITSSSKWNTFKNVVNSSVKYGYSSDAYYYNGGYVFDVFDVGTFFTKIKASNSYKNNTELMDKVNECVTAFNDGVVLCEFHGSGAGTSSGLAFFCPIAGMTSKTTDYSEDSTKLSNWRSLCVKYGTFY